MIDLSREQKKALTQAVNTFNHKVAYHEIKGTVGVPNRVRSKQILQNVHSEADFARELASIKRFGARTAEQQVTVGNNIKISKWEKQEVEIKIAHINAGRAERRAQLEQVELKSQGVPLGYKRIKMDSERMNALKPKTLNWDRFRDKTELKMYTNITDRMASDKFKETTDQIFKDNYIASLKKVYGEKAQDLIDKIQDMPAGDVVDKMYEDQEVVVEFQYDKLDVDVKLQSVREAWGIFPEDEAVKPE